MSSEYRKCPHCGWETKHNNGICNECGRDSNKEVNDSSLLKMYFSDSFASVRCTACGETDRVRDPDDWVCLNCGYRNQRADKSLGFKPKLDLSKLKDFPIALEHQEENRVVVDGNFLLYKLEAEIPPFAEGEVLRADNV